MNFSENISLQQYADAAKQKFDETEEMLSQIEGSFATRTNGKSRGGIIVSICLTVCWIAAMCVFFSYIGGYVTGVPRLICMILSFALLAVLLIDEITGFSYYGKIFTYKDKISQLQERVSVGKNTIKLNQDTFMKSGANGWRHSLSAGTSIPEEAASVESAMNGMESLKGKLLNGLKNGLFFAFVIAVTAVGSWVLFDVAEGLIETISGGIVGSLSYKTMMILCGIGLVVAVIVETILAKLVWSLTNCTVTNVTLLIAIAGPLLFLALVAVASLLVVLVVWAVKIVIAIAGVAIAGACLFGSLSGG